MEEMLAKTDVVSVIVTLIIGIVGVYIGMKISLALLEKEVIHLKESLSSVVRGVEHAATERGRLFERMETLQQRVAKMEGMLERGKGS
jgi:MFS superfamily sulfate permease-like transporter